MAHSRDDALRVAREFLGKAARRHPIRRAFLFGSAAGGRPHLHSDIDLAVVLGTAGSANVAPGGGEAFEVFHEAQELNSALEVICLSEAEFAAGTSPLVRRIKREGIEVPVPVQI